MASRWVCKWHWSPVASAPAKDKTTKAVKQDGGAVREAQSMRLLETDSSSAVPSSKPQQRSADRLREFQPQEKVVNTKWLRLVKQLGQLAAPPCTTHVCRHMAGMEQTGSADNFCGRARQRLAQGRSGDMPASPGRQSSSVRGHRG